MNKVAVFLVVLLSTGIALYTTVLTLAAGGMESPHYHIPWSEFSGGGGRMESSHYRIHGSLSVGLTGDFLSAENRILTGYWAGVSQVYTEQARLFLPILTLNP